MADYLNFWREHALDNIKPEVGLEYPEGMQAIEALQDVIGDGELLEVGCGRGRLAPLFMPEDYNGIDVCAAAIDAAKQFSPGYRFDLVIGDEELPFTATKLCYTVLLHVPDDDLGAMVSRLAWSSERVVVAEILGRHWRRDGPPPVFNRELTEYRDHFARFGMDNCEVTRAPYERYSGTEISIMDFSP
jgi:SAM-dependent methyltransferase